MPETPGRGGKISCVTAEQIGEQLTLALVGLLNHRDEQALFRPEVVDEHAMAGAEIGRHLAQAHVAEPVGGSQLERTRQQVGPRVRHIGHIRLPCHVPDGTCTEWHSQGRS